MEIWQFMTLKVTVTFMFALTYFMTSNVMIQKVKVKVKPPLRSKGL